MHRFNGYDIEVTRGDSLFFKVDLSGRDLPEGSVAYFTVKTGAGSAQPVIKKKLDATDELLDIRLSSADTDLSPRTYFWDVRVLIPLEDGGYEVETPMEYASFTVLPAIGDPGDDPDLPGVDADLPVLALLVEDARRLVARMGELIEQGFQVDVEQVADAVADYLDKNPIDAVTSEELEEEVRSAIQAAAESGEFKGDTGPSGPQGEQGPQGETGPQGPAGVAGEKGEKGDRGETGPTGPAGPQGDKGDTGPAGADGVAGSPGKDGTSITITSISESTVDGGSNVVTFSDGKTVTIKNGSKGSTGASGSNGSNGKDGVSATHSWSGTTLTVTSASGASSANLKGEKGDKGDSGSAGKDGSNGSDGVGVSSVKQTTTSTADGGNNVVTVTLTDGTTSTFTVKNGSKGSTGTAGKTPVKGTDYWTAEDQEAIVQQVIAALGTPVFGTVDENKHITLSGHLADGTYTIRFEDTDGFTAEVCTINKTSVPTYTNLLVPETCTLNKRGNSSGATSDSAGIFITDYIDLGDAMSGGGENILHYKGLYFDVNDLTNAQGTPYTYLNYYDANKTHLGYVSMRQTGDTQTDNGDYVTTLDASKTTARYIRVSAAVSPKPSGTLPALTSKDQLANCKLALNETITD